MSLESPIDVSPFWRGLSSSEIQRFCMESFDWEVCSVARPFDTLRWGAMILF